MNSAIEISGEVLRFGRGDTLVFMVKDQNLSPEHCAELLTQLKTRFSENEVVILSNGIELSAVVGK